MLHKFCSFQLFVSLGLGGLLVLSSCQTNNENTKYLDEDTLDLNQANVDSLRLDKKLYASLFSNSTPGSSRSSYYDPLITYQIPSNLLVNAGKDEMFYDVLDKQIDQITSQVGDSIQRVLSHYNYYFSEQAKESYQIAYRTSCYADWIGLSAPPSPRFSRGICLDDAQYDTATFLAPIIPLACTLTYFVVRNRGMKFVFTRNGLRFFGLAAWPIITLHCLLLSYSSQGFTSLNNALDIKCLKDY